MVEYKPLIKVFKTNRKCYIFEANKNTIIEITQEEYLDLKKYIETDNNELTYSDSMNDLYNRGLLSSKRVKEIIHFDDELVETYIENGLEMLILQVTQQCNFRCNYCAYSGNYLNRVHSNKKMTFSIASRAIDYLIAHSKNNHTVWINFYGGEPLLEFELLKKCIEYAEEKIEGKNIKFAMTTNGYLLKGEVMEFLYEHNVKITISIDGPKEIHDKNRRLVGNNRGSYDVIMNNLASIREKYPDYIESISINSVIDTQNNFENLRNFMERNKSLEGIRITAGGISQQNIIEKQDINKKFILDRKYEIFKCYYSLIRKHENKFGYLLGDEYRVLEKMHGRLNPHLELPDKMHPSGPCIAGAKRLFVTVDGDFYPCEKCSETSELMRLGNIDTGIDCEKVRKISNTGKIDEEACKNCWAIEHCGICQAVLDGVEGEYSKIKRKEICEREKSELEAILKDYCMLKEFGYEFKEEKSFRY